MTEKNFCKNSVHNQDYKNEREKKYKEFSNLLSRATEGIDNLSLSDRERLVEFGYYYLMVEKNKFRAMRAFEEAQDFEGLRKVADTLLKEDPNYYDLPHILTLLEDYEGLRDLLNSDVKLDESVFITTFYPLNEALLEYIGNFLDKNQTPIATGIVNDGVDMVAIRNLARQYDIAVPIARGGLKQGAIANLWEMPTRTVDIAAHKRIVPQGKWVSPVSADDFSNKRVLLFDKDAVSGATIKKAVEMLSHFKPASIGIYFAYNIVPRENRKIGTVKEGLPPGLEMFCPNYAPMQKGGDAYVEAHEKLETLYGRRRKIEHMFTKEIEGLKKEHPDLSKSLKIFISKQLRAFDSLNPFLPGISQVREKILSKLQSLYKDHRDYLNSNLYNLPGPKENFKQVLSITPSLPLGFEEELINARYEKKAIEAAQKRNIENIHNPSFPIAAFDAAFKAAKEGFDVALIVGPEGFAYEPYFHDLGLQTIAVNIPESGENESRSIALFDDLSVLRDKKILVVEDDVRTGATLQKLIECIKPYSPAQLGLYLGQPKNFQKTINIPPDFKDIFMAKTDADQVEAKKIFQSFLESKGLKLFKNGGPDK